MHEFRITKYDPKKRDTDGSYLDQEEWTCFSEVGGKLTLDEYEKVESAYINTAIDFISKSGIVSLRITGLEENMNESGFSENDEVWLSSLPKILSSILRDLFWCRLESERGFIHFGWDYYMYVGVSEISQSAFSSASDRGLFVEEFTSPYHPEEC